MSSFFLALIRALTTPDGSAGGELLSTRRKSHLLQAQWYADLAAKGEAERKAAPAAEVEADLRFPKAAI